MLTDMASEVNDAGGSGLWLSVTDLAKAKGVSKPAISKAVKRWNASGVAVSTRKEGRELLVNVAEYDRARGQFGDLGREQGESTKRGIPLADAAPTYTHEQARKMAYEADLARLKLNERLNELVPVKSLEEATTEFGETLVRTLDRVPSRAEEATAASKDGVAGMRAFLKTLVRDIRLSLADELSKVTVSAMQSGADAEAEPLS